MTCDEINRIILKNELYIEDAQKVKEIWFQRLILQIPWSAKMRNLNVSNEAKSKAVHSWLEVNCKST